MLYNTDLNRIGERGNKWLLLSLIVTLNIIDVYCNVLSKTENTRFITIGSLPKVVTLQTYKDWSSRLGLTTNNTTPKPTLLLQQESKNVESTYRDVEHPMVVSTQDTIENMRDSLVSNSPNAENLTKKDEINAHNIAAQVLSKFVHISPLLALSSNLVKSEIPSYHLNHNITNQDEKYINNNDYQIKINHNLPLIESLNDIDTDSRVAETKSERKSASGISFPTNPVITRTYTTTTIDIPKDIFETTTTEIPSDVSDSHHQYPHPDDDEDYDQEHQESADHPSEDDEPTPPEDPDDYEDDEELESFRYPVRVTFHDNDDDPIPAPDTSPPFMIPNIDINPESLKQKGCRTVVKEVQAIPVENGPNGPRKHSQNSPQSQNNLLRSKRNTEENSRKFTSIVMTKECHFPGDEGASSEDSPQTAVATKSMDDSKRDNTYQTVPQYDEYDPDFDFKPRTTYPSSGLPDILNERQAKSSSNREKYTNKPNYRRESSDYRPKKTDYGFDDSNFYDFNDYLSREDDSRNRPLLQSSPSRHSRDRIQSSPRSDGYDYEEVDYHPRPKSRGRNYNVRTQHKKQPIYRNEANNRNSRQGRRKPKKINRSFAFFRKAEPKEKDPNESDYSVSYGRGNFHSFSDSYDSDKDGPRKGRGMTRSTKYE